MLNERLTFYQKSFRSFSDYFSSAEEKMHKDKLKTVLTCKEKIKDCPSGLEKK